MGGPSGSISRHDDRRKPYSRPQSQGPRRFSHQPQQSQPSRPQCFHCRGPHLRSACPQHSDRRTCHRCGQTGHFIKDCPVDRSTVPRPSSQPQSQPSRGGARPQAAGRVYAVTGAEAAGSGNLIIGSCVIAGKRLHVLFDSGAIHSFMSESRVVELGLPVKEL